MDKQIAEASRFLGSNIETLRKKRGFTQLQLAKLADMPRSTLSYLESGLGNPSLANLSRISIALQASLEELLSHSTANCRLIKSNKVKKIKRSQGLAYVYQLLPDPVPGMAIDRMEISPGGTVGGVPHLRGTKEYLTVLQGQITINVDGQRYVVEVGDVFAFPGDVPHSYQNKQRTKAIGLSVVAIARGY